jgi:hypothetical protein
MFPVTVVCMTIGRLTLAVAVAVVFRIRNPGQYVSVPRRTDDSSVRALAVKSRAFGAPRCGFGA